MLRRMFLLLVLTVMAGCSEGADFTGVPPQSKAEAEKKQPADENQGAGIVDKCAVYRRPPFCAMP